MQAAEVSSGIRIGWRSFPMITPQNSCIVSLAVDENHPEYWPTEISNRNKPRSMKMYTATNNDKPKYAYAV